MTCLGYKSQKRIFLLQNFRGLLCKSDVRIMCCLLKIHRVTGGNVTFQWKISDQSDFSLRLQCYMMSIAYVQMPYTQGKIENKSLVCKGAREPEHSIQFYTFTLLHAYATSNSIASALKHSLQCSTPSHPIWSRRFTLKLQLYRFGGSVESFGLDIL